jgi:hypothetical protein
MLHRSLANSATASSTLISRAPRLHGDGWSSTTPLTMSLQIAADDFALHQAGDAVTDAIKNMAPWQTNGLYTLPQYPTAASIEDGPTIPSPALFKTLVNPGQISAETESLPSVAECAVHLEFLAALHALRHSIVGSDALAEVLEIKPNFKIVSRRGVETKLKDETLWTRKQVMWEHYLHLAVARFLVWWENVPAMVDQAGQIQITDDTLPPIGRYNDIFCGFSTC